MRLHFSGTATRHTPAPERIARSVLMGAALVLAGAGCKPEPLDDSDAGVGGSAMGGSATGGAVTGGVASGGRAATAGTAAGGESCNGTAGAGGGACCVLEQSAPPFTTTFRFTNPGPDPRWLTDALSCRIDFTVTSCRDGYQRSILVLDLSAGARCPAACPDCTAECSPCLAGAVPVAAGSYRDVVWNGYDPVAQSLYPGCDCVTTPNAPAGLYRVTVPVWDSDPLSDGGSGQWWQYPAYTVTQDFTLDHAGGVVELRL